MRPFHPPQSAMMCLKRYCASEIKLIINWQSVINKFIHFFQAKDKMHWQKLFSHFCSRTGNEEEEIAHKLLGEQFKASFTFSFRIRRSLKCETFQICQFKSHIAAFHRSLSRVWLFPLRALNSCCASFCLWCRFSVWSIWFLLLLLLLCSAHRGSWPCYTVCLQPHFMMSISVGWVCCQ